MIRRRPIPRSNYRWLPHPKPANVLRWEIILNGAVVRMPDGREICQDNASGRREYKRRMEIMVQRQGFRCSLCNRRISLATATFEHTRRRGAGGSRRDDRITNEQGECNSAAHWVCNSVKG